VAAVNLLGLCISMLTDTHYHVDLLGTGAFALVAAATFGEDHRQNLSSAAIFVWAVKLAVYLFYRSLQTGHDERLRGLLSSASGAFFFWTASFLWCWSASLPHTLAAGLPRDKESPPSTMQFIGLALFAVGFTIETMADWQKWNFKQNPTNQNRFCDIGLWKFSQHPNWFGNLLVWIGILGLNLPALSTQTSSVFLRGGLIAGACASPVFLASIFYAQASGAVSPAVSLAQMKYGSDSAFQQYVETVPLILPTLTGFREMFFALFV